MTNTAPANGFNEKTKQGRINEIMNNLMGRGRENLFFSYLEYHETRKTFYDRMCKDLNELAEIIPAEELSKTTRTLLDSAMVQVPGHMPEIITAFNPLLREIEKQGGVKAAADLLIDTGKGALGKKGIQQADIASLLIAALRLKSADYADIIGQTAGFISYAIESGGSLDNEVRVLIGYHARRTGDSLVSRLCNFEINREQFMEQSKGRAWEPMETSRAKKPAITTVAAPKNA